MHYTVCHKILMHAITLIVIFVQGALENGQVFDTSRREGRSPFSVTLGASQVIKGDST